MPIQRDQAQNGKKKYLNSIDGVRTYDIDHTFPMLRPLGYQMMIQKEDKKFRKIFKCMAKVGLVRVGLCCKMSPRKLVISSAIRRPPYKTTVAENIYITTCYGNIPDC